MIRYYIDRFIPMLICAIIGWLIGSALEMHDLRKLHGKLFLINEQIERMRREMKLG